MKKILISAHSSAITESLTETLCCEHMIFTCSVDCLSAAIEALQPDAIVIDITLIGIDGLLKLRNAAYIPPVIFVVTNILTEHLLLAAQEVGADYIARYPFSLDAMVQRLDDLLC